MRGDISTVALDEFFDTHGDAQAEDALDRAGLTDMVRDSEGGGSFAELAKKYTAPMKRGAGKLLEERDRQKVFKHIDEQIKRQKRLAKNRQEEGEHHKQVRNGNPFSVLEKSEDRSVYKQATPDFAEGMFTTPIPNKMEELCKVVINQMLADDFLPNPKPDGDTDKDRGAADLTKKFLRNDATASGTNDKQMLREALNTNITQKSAFAMVWVDPMGGGWRPKQVLAHPQALDANKPMLGPKMDPVTKKPVIGPDGVAVMERAKAPVLRYIAETEGPPDPADPTGQPTTQRQFTKDPARAARLWQPKLRRTMLHPNQVRTVPATADVFEAEEIDCLMWEPLGEAKKRFPILTEMSAEQLRTLTKWKPDNWRALVPEAHRPKLGGEENYDGANDDAILFWFHHFCRISARYVDGSEIAVSGAEGGILLKRDTLREDVKSDDGVLVPVLMDPPVTQFMGLQDEETGDPFGKALIATFSGANEAFAQIWMGLLEAMDKAVHLNVMLPSLSSITRAEWNRRDGTPLDVIGGPHDKPYFEEAPQIPQFIDKMLEQIEVHLNTAAGTNETASGLDSKFSISGKAKEVAIKQARVQLAQYWQNTVNGITYWWKLKAQRAQAYYTVPMQVKLAGEESVYKQPWWTGSDLLGVIEIALQPGTGSMMTPAEKAQWVGMLQQAGWIDQVTAGEIVRASMTDDLGLPPNVHEERINRCIAKWSEGEPADWLPTFEAHQQYQAAYQQWQAQAWPLMQQLQAAGTDPETAQQTVMTELPPPQEVPTPWTPFDRRPNDEDPDVAVLQYGRMNKAASSAEYGKHSAAWQSVFDEAFARIAAAAGKKSFAQLAAEQQAAAQAEADARTRGETQKGADKASGEQAKAQDKDAQRQHDAAERTKDRDHELEVQARDAMVKEGEAAVTAAGQSGATTAAA